MEKKGMLQSVRILQKQGPKTGWLERDEQRARVNEQAERREKEPKQWCLSFFFSAIFEPIIYFLAISHLRTLFVLF
jgi:hypothetical protein